jgi:hypothetical protein
MDASSPVRKSVTYGSDVSEGVQLLGYCNEMGFSLFNRIQKAFNLYQE